MLTSAGALAPPAAGARRVATVGRGWAVRPSAHRSCLLTVNQTVANDAGEWYNMVAGLELSALGS